MTYEEYISKIQSEVDDTSLGAKAVISQELSSVYSDIMLQVGKFLEKSITEEQAIVIGQTLYSTAYDPSVIHQVSYRSTDETNFSILNQISIDEYNDVYINRPNSTPINWYLDGDTPGIAPKPDKEGILRIVYTPNITVFDTGQTSILPDRYSQVIIDGVISKFKAWENNLAASQYYDTRYQQGLHFCFLDLSNRANPLKPKLYGI